MEVEKEEGGNLLSTEEEIKFERMKELEAMVQKLTIENKELLNQVNKEDTAANNTPSTQDISPYITTPTTTPMESEFVPLNITDIEEEDTWLYVSPLRPPTREQKSMTPLEWLNKGQEKRKGNYSSFLDIKKSLAFTMDKAEQLTTGHMTTGTTKGRTTPTNKTAQKYLDDVRRRRGSLSGSEDGSSLPNSPPPRSPSPSATFTVRQVKNYRNVPVKPVMGRGGRGGGGKVMNNEEEEMIPIQRKWKVKQVLDEETLQQTTNKWKVRQVSDQSSMRGASPLRTPSPADVPVRKWKVKQVPDQMEPSEGGVGTFPKRTPSPGDVPQRKWKVKQVPDEDPIPQTTKWKVKQVPDQMEPFEGGMGTSPKRTPSPGDVPQRKWKVKQVPNEDPIPQTTKWKVKQVPDQMRPSEGGVGTSPMRTPSPEDVPQRKWRVKQVPDEDPIPQTTKWKVKQVPDQMGFSEGYAGTSPLRTPSPGDVPVRKWKVKQVPSEDIQIVSDESSHDNLERRDTFTRRKKTPHQQDTGSEEGGEEGGTIHDQIERRSTFTRGKTGPTTGTNEEGGVINTHCQVERRDTFTRNSPVERGEGEEGEGGEIPVVKRGGTFTRNTPVEGEDEIEERGGGVNKSGTFTRNTPVEGEEEEEGERGEGGGDKKHATVKRSGTFTKDDKPKVVKRIEDSDRESPCSDRTVSPLEPENPLKMKWTPKRNLSPSSSEDDTHKTHSPASPRDSPIQHMRQSRLTSHMTSTTKPSGLPRGRIPSPVRISPLQQRQAPPTSSDVGGVKVSPGGIPKQTLPSPRMIRPPSPRRTTEVQSNETTPKTTPTRKSPMTTPTTGTRQPVKGLATPGRIKASPQGVKNALTPPQTSSGPPQRKRALPVVPQTAKVPSPRSAVSSGIGRGGNRQTSSNKDISRGVRVPKPVTPPQPQQQQGGNDDSWLDDCF